MKTAAVCRRFKLLWFMLFLTHFPCLRNNTCLRHPSLGLPFGPGGVLSVPLRADYSTSSIRYMAAQLLRPFWDTSLSTRELLKDTMAGLDLLRVTACVQAVRRRMAEGLGW